MIPPPEFEEKDVVWKLNICIYGLSDASRNLYLHVKKELDKLAVLNQHYFFWHFKNELQGLLVIHVDNLCWSGTKTF